MEAWPDRKAGSPSGGRWEGGRGRWGAGVSRAPRGTMGADVQVGVTADGRRSGLRFPRAVGLRHAPVGGRSLVRMCAQPPGRVK